MRLPSERYEEIKKIICEFLADYDVYKLPVDVFELAEKMKIKIVRASEMLKKHPKKVDEYLIYALPPSYLFYSNEIQKIIIYLDDVGTKIKRQRFSIAHEIMHIILGHTEQNSKNEAEANFGATYLLAPTSLALVVGAYNLLIDPNIVVDVFDVSYPEAQIISRYFENRIKCNAEVKDYEEELNNRFCDSLQDRLNIYR